MLKSSPVTWLLVVGLCALAFAGAAFAFHHPMWSCAPLLVAVVALDQAASVWLRIHD